MGGTITLGFRKGGKIRLFAGHTSDLRAFKDQRTLDGDPEAWRELEAIVAHNELREGTPVAPDGYGLVFLDMDGRSLWSIQNYASISWLHVLGARQAEKCPPEERGFFNDLDALEAARAAGVVEKVCWTDEAQGRGECEASAEEAGLGPAGSAKAAMAGPLGVDGARWGFVKLSRPGWRVFDGEGSAEPWTEMIAEMADAGILSGSSEEAALWDRYCSDIGFGERPGAALRARGEEVEILAATPRSGVKKAPRAC